MMHKIHLILCFSLIFLALSCVKQEFDSPPIKGVSNLTVNTTIGELKDMWIPGREVDISDDIIISGIVVSDDTEGNFFKQLIIQDETGGIEIRMDAVELNVDYPRGRRVFVKCKGLTINDYNNFVQLTYDGERIPEVMIQDYIERGPIESIPAPQVLRIDQLSQDMVGTLVAMEDVEFNADAAGTPYADAVNMESINHIVEDCIGNEIILRSSGFAGFADSITPLGSGSVTAVLSIFRNDFQLLIRDLADVSMPNQPCNRAGNQGLSTLNVDFESFGNNENIEMAGWINIALKGQRTWLAKEFSGNTYAQATAFNDNSSNMETWLITPRLNLDSPKKISFETAQAFWRHDGLIVLISTDFNGNRNNITNATWVELPATIAKQSDPEHGWVDSGDIDLSMYSGTGYVGFKYEGNSAQNTTSYRIDNLVFGDQ